MEKIDLIRQCQTGDKDSLGKLYRIYSQNALGTAYLISNSRGIAEDIVQEAFIQCFKHIRNLRDPQTFDAWFYKILVTTGWRMVKKHNRYMSAESRNIDESASVSNFNNDFDAFANSLSLKQALNKLSFPLKTVVILFYYNQMPIKDIAKITGCFQGTVKSRLHNARKQLYYELCGELKEGAYLEKSLDIYKRKGYNLNGKHG
ncbi:RNA polymerase sigma factor [Pseudobacteroides cellulosolvens]|uniref:RNA polymerase, sigma-24 subunit, RpoE, ECF subfamily n=1 Tax=Pseudobacteroides cellulosolvens ATCC 35603 = DSM 2933 TaxID=398512 RepID=A0A0L6JQT0_9FIRM|nr:RNA polymerase sigma factor [Pseudobacteroides cellulosolvens]KNY28154.1 RNA polymerase, sigma-24 subunit, RpoE, ECF subfamily [Pseudobacteroides cellulosolvens ATCC 35603 = DSM 2933]